MLNELLANVKKIRDAVYGLDVRKAIADSLESAGNYVDKTKKDTDKLIENQNGKIDAQNNRIDELEEHYRDVITSGGDSVLEIVDARVPFACLKDKLEHMERVALESSEDIIIGGERDKKFIVTDEEGETLGIISKEGANFEEITVKKIISPSVVGIQKLTTLYVDVNTGNDANSGSQEYPFKSILAAINSLDKFLVGNIAINVKAGVYNEEIKLYGFTGPARIEITFEEGSTLNGDIVVLGNTARLFIYGNNLKLNYEMFNSGFPSVCAAEATAYLYLKQIHINGAPNSNYGISSRRGSGVYVTECTIDNITAGSVILAQECSTVTIHETVGSNNKYGLKAWLGGTIYVHGKVPVATTQIQTATHGQIVGNPVPTASSNPSNPGAGNTVTEVILKPTNIGSYRSVDGWTLGNATHRLYMGKYNAKNSNNYNWRGLMQYNPSDIVNKLGSKTIVSATIDINRKPVGGDYSTVTVKLYGTTAKIGSSSRPPLTYDYGTLGTASKGKDMTFTLPVKAVKDLKAGNINSLVLAWADGTNEVRNYSIFELSSGTIAVKVK